MGIGRLFDLIIARGNMQSKVNNSKTKFVFVKQSKATLTDFRGGTKIVRLQSSKRYLRKN